MKSARCLILTASLTLRLLVGDAPCHAEESPVSILAARIGGHIHPSICQAHDGTLVVVYQGKNVLMVSRSADGGAHWSAPRAIATTAVRPQEIRKVARFEIYPGTLDTLPDGRLLVTWNYIADDKAKDGYYQRALLYTLSTDQGLTWTTQQLIGPVDGTHLGAVRHNVLPWDGDRWLLPLRDGPPRLFHATQRKLTVYPVVGPDRQQHEFQQITRTASGSLLAMGPILLHSVDKGQAWSEVKHFPAIPDQRDNAEGRYLTALSDGRVLVTWGIGHDNKGLRFNLSTDDGRTWDPRRTVHLLAETSIAARYYSARTIQLDAQHVGTVFMNPEGIHFLRTAIARFTP